MPPPPLITHLPDIHPKLYLGSRRAVDYIQTEFPHIEASMCVASNGTCDYTRECQEKGLQKCESVHARDQTTSDPNTILAFTTDAANQINDLLDVQKKNVLVHCRAGRNRSVASIVRYAMLFQQMKGQETINYIREQNFKQRKMPHNKTLSNQTFEIVLLNSGKGIH